LYFDDEPANRKRLARELSSAKLGVEHRSPPPDLSLPEDDDDWDALLVDYELTKRTEQGTANYRGGTLGYALRERMREVPLILITREKLRAYREASALLEELPVFDEIIFKSVADDNPGYVRRRIISAAEGFAALRAAEKSWDGLTELLAPPTDEDLRLLRRVHPPTVSGTWRVVSTARWIERVLLRYPGPLLDSLHASALLGVDEAELASRRMASALRAGEYSGPLPADGKRWWKGWLLEFALGTLQRATKPMPPFLNFRSAFEKRHRYLPAPSKCVDCGEPADQVCFVLKAPVRTDHSILYYPDLRPSAMTPARVSFKAINETNDVDHDLIDPIGLALADARRK
jgi:hypothetical protein